MSESAPGWVRDAVFYQIFPDRFARSGRVSAPGPLEPWDVLPTRYGFKGGDLYGIAERLDELAELGVTALYLTPVFASAANHRYHTYDYLAVDPLLGGDAALRALVDALHARGMRLVLDGVFNHTGRGFWAFHHVVENGLQSPYVDWFHVDRERLAAGHGLQPYPGRAGAERVPGYAAWWNLPALPKLNTAHPPVREYLLRVAEHWLAFGIDGWRLDVPTEIDDPAFWREFRERCRAVRADAYLVGEIWDVRPEWTGANAFDGLMNYPLLAAILAFVADGALDRELLGIQPDLAKRDYTPGAAVFAERLAALLAAYPPATVAAQLNLLSSHDMPRFRSLACGDVRTQLLGTLLQMSLPGAPCIYYGDELGMLGGADPDCRRAYPAGEEGRDAEVRAAFRALVAARHAVPALRSDRVALVAAAGPALALERGGADDATAAGDYALVGVNAGAAPATLAFTVPALAGRRMQVRASVGEAPATFTFDAAGAATLVLAPRSGAVLQRAG